MSTEGGLHENLPGEPTAAAARRNPVTRGVVAFGRFWWDFLIGDTPELFLATVVVIGLAEGLHHAGTGNHRRVDRRGGFLGGEHLARTKTCEIAQNSTRLH